MSTPHETIGEYLAEAGPAQVLWHHLSTIVGDGESRVAALEKLTLPAATIFLVGLFEGEVVRGGFLEFFRDHSGDHANDTVQALREIGAHVSVELLEKALDAFPGGVAPTPPAERAARLDATDPATFAPFDELYNRHIDAPGPDRLENLDALLVDYMRAHAAVRLTN